MSHGFQIVPTEEILSKEAIKGEIWNIVKLDESLKTPELALKWCARRGLVRNSVLCHSCCKPSLLINHRQGIDLRKWECRPCHLRKTVRDSSLFSRSRFSLRSVILLIYCWCADMPQKQMCRESGVDSRTCAIDWCRFMRDECEKWLKQNNCREIGGMDENGKPVFVEIGESKFFKLRSRWGKDPDGVTVFGGVDRLTGNCFLKVVPNMTEGTVLRIIEENILPGSHIISNDCSAYKKIKKIRNGIYTHSVAGSNNRFMEDKDPDIYLQTIKSIWMRARMKLKRQTGTTREQFPSYLSEFEYRTFFRKEDIFSNLLVSISENHDCKTLQIVLPNRGLQILQAAIFDRRFLEAMEMQVRQVTEVKDVEINESSAQATEEEENEMTEVLTDSSALLETEFWVIEEGKEPSTLLVQNGQLQA